MSSLQYRNDGAHSVETIDSSKQGGVSTLRGLVRLDWSCSSRSRQSPSTYEHSPTLQTLSIFQRPSRDSFYYTHTPLRAISTPTCWITAQDIRVTSPVSELCTKSIHKVPVAKKRMLRFQAVICISHVSRSNTSLVSTAAGCYADSGHFSMPGTPPM